jgi:ribosome-associated protein
MQGGQATIEPMQLARLIAEAASEAKATDVVVIDIRELTVVADFFVICSADNERLLRAVGRTIMEATAGVGLDPRRSEGTADSGWMLLDYADVVVHIFGQAERQFYRLEDAWAEGRTLLVIQ